MYLVEVPSPAVSGRWLVLRLDVHELEDLYVGTTFIIVGLIYDRRNDYEHVRVLCQNGVTYRVSVDWVETVCRRIG